MIFAVIAQQPDLHRALVEVSAGELLDTVPGLFALASGWPVQVRAGGGLPGATADESVRVIRGGMDPLIADADLRASGELDDRIEGRASRKDDSELRVALTLVEHLNASGAHWGGVELRRGREDGIDAVARDGDATLRVQVTTPERAAWSQLASAGEVRRSDETTDRAIDGIKAAIEGKLLFAGRDSIVLALDATDSPSYALAGVAEAFGERHGEWASETGYAAVWLVGPVASLVHRLD